MSVLLGVGLLLAFDAALPGKGALGNPIIVEMISAEWTGNKYYLVESVLPGMRPLWVPSGGWLYEIRVEWVSYYSCPRYRLYRDGDVIADGIWPYETEPYYDPQFGALCNGWYRYFDWVQEGAYCYEAYGSCNGAVCGEVP
ncbi:MAG: hypothetical protein H5U38_08115 [Calditrichaeota bacterium]|nr:hypothetical protein [Calditrichota bacterium]